MNAPSVDIVEMLEVYPDSSSSDAEGLGLVYGENLFIGHEPKDPIDTVTVTDTPGRPDWMGLTDVGYEYPSVQIRIRNAHYLDAMNLGKKIKDALHGRAGESWNGAFYTLIQCMNGPALIDWDDNNRPIVILNFNLQRR